VCGGGWCVHAPTVTHGVGVQYVDNAFARVYVAMGISVPSCVACCLSEE